MASIVKMRGTEVGQKMTELAVEAVGWYGTPFTELQQLRQQRRVPVGGGYTDDAAPRYFNHPQDDDLWRILGSAEERARQGDAGPLTRNIDVPFGTINHVYGDGHHSDRRCKDHICADDET